MGAGDFRHERSLALNGTHGRRTFVAVWIGSDGVSLKRMDTHDEDYRI